MDNIPISEVLSSIKNSRTFNGAAAGTSPLCKHACDMIETMKKKSIICILIILITILSGCSIEKIVLPAQKEVTDKTIKDIFEEHEIKAGTCVSSYVIGNSSMSDLILEQFCSITMENAMKPDYILNQDRSKAEGRLIVEYNNEAVSILKWAQENDLSMRGHTLIWYSQTPDWIFREGFDNKGALVGRWEMLTRMESLISGNFEELKRLGYLDLFYAYDVVNEALIEDGSIRKSHWTETIGDDYIWYAFYFADKYAPQTIDLYYNDYNEQYKADHLAEFVGTLTDEDGRSLIDGIGLQAHLYTSDDLKGYFNAVDTLAQTDLKLQLTEVDVGLGKYQNPLSPTDANLKNQGRFCYDLISGLFERVDSGMAKIDAITFWGFSDGISWRKEYSPQLYDSDLNPKYALYGAMQIYDYSGYK